MTLTDTFFTRIGNLLMWASLFSVFELNFQELFGRRKRAVCFALFILIGSVCNILQEMLPLPYLHYPLFILNYLLWGSVYGSLLFRGPFQVKISIVSVQVCIWFQIQGILGELFGVRLLQETPGLFMKLAGILLSFAAGWFLGRVMKRLRRPVPPAYSICILSASALSMLLLIVQTQLVGKGISSLFLALNSASSLGILLVVYWQSNRLIEYYENGMVQMTQENELQANKDLAFEVTRLNDEIRRMRHERNHQLQTLSRLYEDSHQQEARSFLEELCTDGREKKGDMSGHESETLHSGNLIIDSVLNPKIAAARAFGIDLEINVHLDADLPFSSADLSSLLSNLLDNAIEASVQVSQPAVRIEILPFKGYLRIDISNKVKENILRVNPDLATTKRNAGIHGIGLQVVERIAERYSGFSQYSMDEKGWFHARVMLLMSA